MKGSKITPKTAAPKLKKVRTIYRVSEYVLPNGLRVLFRRQTAAPVVAVCITFHVGSRNETAGNTGYTHILEHLLFKDSTKFNRANGNAITDYLDWFGAILNATTWFDRTNYFEMLPNDKLEEALAMEADRLRGSLFTDEDLASEMTVVRNEFERSRNNPFELLDEEVMSVAFTKHPYRIPTIGSKEDIEASTAAKLREFYDKFYWPNNATLTVVGDVQWRDVARLVEAYFGPIPTAPHKIPTMSVVEPAQTSQRTCRVVEPLGLTIVEALYKIPAGTHKDYAALLTTLAVLAGGFSSILQKKLVDSGLAAGMSYSAFALHDPAAASFTVHVAEGVDPQTVVDILHQEIAEFTKAGPSTKQLMYAKERLMSQFSAERDGVLNEARMVSEAIAAGDWTLNYRLVQDIKKVTAADTKRVAKKYLQETGETVGVLVNE
jgi:zinc protease